MLLAVLSKIRERAELLLRENPQVTEVEIYNSF